MSRALTFVTGNIKKLEEIKAILGTNFPHEVRSEKIDLPGMFGMFIDIFLFSEDLEQMPRK